MPRKFGSSYSGICSRGLPGTVCRIASTHCFLFGFTPPLSFSDLSKGLPTSPGAQLQFCNSSAGCSRGDATLQISQPLLPLPCFRILVFCYPSANSAARSPIDPSSNQRSADSQPGARAFWDTDRSERAGPSKTESLFHGYVRPVVVENYRRPSIKHQASYRTALHHRTPTTSAPAAMDASAAFHAARPMTGIGFIA